MDDEAKICRSCFRTDELKSIFKHGKVLDELVTLSDLLKELLSVEVSTEDGLPSYLCSQCVIKLVKAVTFKRDCLNAYNNFKQKTKKSNVEESTDWILEAKDSGQEELQTSTAVERTITVAYSIDEIQNIEIKSNPIINDEPFVQETPQNDQPLVFRQYKKSQSESQSFVCPECGKVLSKRSSYQYHMNLHSKTYNFECSECHERFKTKNAFDGHMTIHNGQFTCEVCSKSYRQEASLKSHMLSHTGEKPYRCEICGKGMTQKSGWKKHMLTHSDTKLYVCDICNKEFRYSSNLFVHMRMHIGEKLYQCDTCKKRFAAKEQLKRHCLTHTDLKPFSCVECGKSFNRKSTLNVHLRLHDPNARKYKCQNCLKGFNHVRTYVNHQNECEKLKQEEVNNV